MSLMIKYSYILASISLLVVSVSVERLCVSCGFGFCGSSSHAKRFPCPDHFFCPNKPIQPSARKNHVAKHNHRKRRRLCNRHSPSNPLWSPNPPQLVRYATRIPPNTNALHVPVHTARSPATNLINLHTPLILRPLRRRHHHLREKPPPTSRGPSPQRNPTSFRRSLHPPRSQKCYSQNPYKSICWTSTVPACSRARKRWSGGNKTACGAVGGAEAGDEGTLVPAGEVQRLRGHRKKGIGQRQAD